MLSSCRKITTIVVGFHYELRALLKGGPSINSEKTNGKKAVVSEMEFGPILEGAMAHEQTIRIRATGQQIYCKN